MMPKKRFNAEQIVVLLRQIEVLLSQGKAAPVACREAGISEQSYYRWRKEYGGLELDQAKRTKDLEREKVRPPCHVQDARCAAVAMTSDRTAIASPNHGEVTQRPISSLPICMA